MESTISGKAFENSRQPIIVAVDGLSASGKGTIGRIISEHLNFQYLDTGLLYRAVAHKFLTSLHTLDRV